MSMGQFLVSVRLMTFNHEQYIKQAIEGILMQQANFIIELVIGDDFSNDSTLTIIKSYVSTERVQFKILDRKIGDVYSVTRQVKGRLYNFADILENCTGKYIALLDGDDYWTDPNKLQKQVDFLETHPDYSMCFHQADLLFEDGTTRKCNYFDKDLTLGFKDLVNKNVVSTASCVFRNSFQTMPEWFYNLQAGDWGLHLLNAERGKIYYMNDTMSVYRMHQGGLWTKLTYREVESRNIKNLQTLNEAFNFQYNGDFEAAINDRKLKLQKMAENKGFFNILKSKIKRILIGLKVFKGSTILRKH